MTDKGLLHAGFTMRSSSYPTLIGSWQSFTAAEPMNDGQWHHLSYTLWNSGAMLVVDGIKVAGYTGLVRPLPEPGSTVLIVEKRPWSPVPGRRCASQPFPKNPLTTPAFPSGAIQPHSRYRMPISTLPGTLS